MNENAELSGEVEPATFQIRLPKKLRDEFIETAKVNNVSAASLVKNYMRNYLRLHKHKISWGD